MPKKKTNDMFFQVFNLEKEAPCPAMVMDFEREEHRCVLRKKELCVWCQDVCELSGWWVRAGNALTPKFVPPEGWLDEVQKLCPLNFSEKEYVERVHFAFMAHYRQYVRSK